MGDFIKGVKNIFGRKKRKQKRQERADHLRDPLQDSLAGSGIRDRLKKKGGKTLKGGSGYQSVLDRVELAERDEGLSSLQDRHLDGAVLAIDDWVEKHGRKGKRGKALMEARGGLQARRDGLRGQGREDLSAYLQGGDISLQALSQQREWQDQYDQERWRFHDEAHAIPQEERGDELLRRRDDFNAGRRRLVPERKRQMAQMEEEVLDKQVQERGMQGGQQIRELGTGMMGTAHLADFGGQEMVFKADEQIPEIMADMVSANLGAHRAVASSEVADLLGSGVIGRTEFAEMDGQQGSVMPLARGGSVREEVDLGGDQELQTFALESGIAGMGGKAFVPGMDVDYSDPVLQRELMELQVNDVLSGQIDRHSGNYHVEKDEEGKVIGVHGFDNDGSFGAVTDWKGFVESGGNGGNIHYGNVVGLPPLLNQDQADRILAMEEDALRLRLGSLLPEPELEAAVSRLRELQAHVKDLEAGGQIVEQYDQQSYELLMHAGDKGSYVSRDSNSVRRMGQLKQRMDEAG